MTIKRLILLPMFLLLTAGCISVYSQSESDEMTKAAPFFEGTWKMDGKEIYESWETGCGPYLSGKGYTIENGSEKISENLEIRILDSKVYLLATVPDQNNGATIKFARTNSGDDEFVFENPEHDFPKKIAYKKLSATQIEVRVEGESGKGFSFTMTKLKPAQ